MPTGRSKWSSSGAAYVSIRHESPKIAAALESRVEHHDRGGYGLAAAVTGFNEVLAAIAA
jgi:hypothetical protein